MGKFSGIIKHPQGHFINKNVLKYSLFGLSDSIELAKTCHFDPKFEKKIIKKLEFLKSLNSLEVKRFDFRYYCYTWVLS